MSSKSSTKPNKVLRATIWGGLILFLSGFITGLSGVCNLIRAGTGMLNGTKIGYGVKASILNYFKIWKPYNFPSETAYIGQVLILFAIFLFVVTTIIAIIKKEYLRIFPSFMLFLGICFLPYLILLTVPMIQLRVMNAAAIFVISIATLLNILAIVFLVMPVVPLIRVGWYAVAGVVTGEKTDKEDEKEEEPVVEEPVGITEKDVRRLAEEAVHEHELNKHNNPEPVAAPEPKPETKPEPAPAPIINVIVNNPAPAPEPEPEEEVEEDEDEDEEVIDTTAEEPAEVDPNDPFAALASRKRRAKFETRIKSSDADLRHKYYDLRDYIRWYGISDRISRPGHTFSYKREKFIFIAVSGKHLKVYFNINPDNYATSPIPVERVESKRFEDLPCVLKVRSDLSYRRAKQLIDDVMAAKGVARPEGEAPAESQDED